MTKHKQLTDELNSLIKMRKKEMKNNTNPFCIARKLTEDIHSIIETLQNYNH